MEAQNRGAVSRGSRRRTLLVAVACTLLATALAPRAFEAGPAHAGAPTSTLPVVVEGDVVDVYSSDLAGVHIDRWVVWVCHLEPGGPVPERLPIDADDVVAALDAEIAPYYEWLSQGAYQPTYSPGGIIDAGSNDPDTAMTTCLTDATAAPASVGFAGALVIADAPIEDAVGQSGHQACDSPPCVGSTTFPDNQRTITLGAHDLFTTTTIGAPWLSEAAHEFGHTIDWGHAGPPPGYRVLQPAQPGYQPTAADAPWLDQIDPALLAALNEVIEAQGLPSIESDRATLGTASVDCNTIFTTPPTTPGWSLCLLLTVLEYGDLYDVMGSDPSPLTPDTRAIPQTQVFNRYAAGWLDDDDVVTHPGGTVEYAVAPIDVDGTQMLVLPSSDPRRYFTVEARGPTEFLPGLENAGVLVHVVDQRPDACGGPICWGDSAWKTMLVNGTPWSRNQLLEPGDSVAVDGVPVSVVRADDDGTYLVRVGPTPPAPGPPPGGPTSPATAANPVSRAPSFTG